MAVIEIYKTAVLAEVDAVPVEIDRRFSFTRTLRLAFRWIERSLRRGRTGQTSESLRSFQNPTMNATTFKELLKESTQVDLKRRKELEKTLAKEARQHIRSLAESIASDMVAVRRGAVEILRRISSDQDALGLLVERLGIEPDVKTRRRIAAAIADSGQSKNSGALLDQLEREEHRFVQASLILALGKLGFRNWPKHWLDFTDKEGPVAEAMRKAGSSYVTHAGDSLDHKQCERPAGAYMLQHYPGLEPLVKLELQQGHLSQAVIETPGWLRLPGLTSDTVPTLERLRTIVADYHLALNVASTSNHDAKVLLSKAIVRIVGAAPYLGQGCTFRLSLPAMDTRDNYRKLVVSLSRNIERTTNWLNNPSDYDVDLRLIRFDSTDSIIWRDRRWLSARQTDSRLVVPASIHPSVAAALCFAAAESDLSRTLTSGGAGKVLLDPCCGAGTILSEWLSIFVQAQAIGYDVSETAIHLSRQNLQTFKTRCQVRVADMRALPLKASSLDFIVCNLPFGIRVKHEASNRTLYAGFLMETSRILRPGGTLVTYTADARAMESALPSVGWKNVEPLTKVKAGGLDVTIHRVRKP